jgi:hypothetical protein
VFGDGGFVSRVQGVWSLCGPQNESLGRVHPKQLAQPRDQRHPSAELHRCVPRGPLRSVEIRGDCHVVGHPPSRPIASLEVEAHLRALTLAFVGLHRPGSVAVIPREFQWVTGRSGTELARRRRESVRLRTFSPVMWSGGIPRRGCRELADAGPWLEAGGRTGHHAMSLRS